MSGVPYVFGNATTSIPLSQLDVNFATNATIGTTSVGLGNTTTTLVGLANVSTTVVNTSNVSANTSLLLQTNGTTTAVTIDTSQNVGIGCTPLGSAYTGVKTLEIGSQAGHGLIGWNSSNEIDLVSNVYVDSSANYKYANTSAASLYYQSNGGHNWLYAASGTAGNTITFITEMKLDSSGNLLVGTTTTPNGTFACKSNFIGLQTSNPADSSKWRQMVFASNSADATLYFPNGSNTPTLSSAGAWTNASDGRQKTNITDIKYGLDTVLASQPHSYNRTDVEGDYLGFVAQELKTLIPEVVFGSEETSYSVDYGSLVAVAFKAIQELSAQVTTLQTQVTALQAKVGV